MAKLLLFFTLSLLCFSSFAQMTERQFKRVLHSVEEVYEPVVNALGARLIVYSGYQFNTVNALAQRDGNKWMISFYGGLGKHRKMSEDGLRSVVCHELGHHLGGAPFKLDSEGTERWASAEAQADYFAASQCLPNVFKNDGKSEEVVSALPEELRREFENFCTDAICLRTLWAIHTSTAVFNSLHHDEVMPSFSTPDLSVAQEVEREYPSSQCRLDTMLAGALGQVRPSCWFVE